MSEPLSYIFLTCVNLCYCIFPRFLLICKILSCIAPIPPFPLRSIATLAPLRFFFVPLRTLTYVQFMKKNVISTIAEILRLAAALLAGFVGSAI